MGALSFDEKELLLRLRNGDKIAFAQLYDSYKERLTANVFKLLKSWDDTEEIVQKLFVKVWENRSQIDVEKTFPSYLYRIASNLVNDYFRKISRDKKLSERLWQHLTELYDPEFLHEQVKADQELMRTIEKLPTQRQKVFKLCKLEGKSYAEVSHMLSISEATINEHISKANKFLRDHYDKTIPLLVIICCFRILNGL